MGGATQTSKESWSYIPGTWMELSLAGGGAGGRVSIVLHSMTDLLMGLLGTPTEDASPLGERDEDSRWGRCC